MSYRKVVFLILCVVLLVLLMESSAMALPMWSCEGPSEEYVVDLAIEDKLKIAKIIHINAWNEPEEAQAAVAASIIRQLNSTSKTVSAIVERNGAYLKFSHVSDEVAELYFPVLEKVLRGWDPTSRVFVDGARFFCDITGCSIDLKEGVDMITFGNLAFFNTIVRVVRPTVESSIPQPPQPRKNQQLLIVPVPVIIF